VQNRSLSANVICRSAGIIVTKRRLWQIVPEIDILDIFLTSLHILQRHSAIAAEWAANFGKFCTKLQFF
jgi:hypothetical protein